MAMLGARVLTCAMALAAGLAMAGCAAAADRHAGYYYPEPTSQETYQARVPTLADSDRRRRIGFVTALTAEMLNNPYPPQYAVFAKGAEAEKLIITALYGNGIDTLYRARGLFAMLTAVARATTFFRETNAPENYTFFDLCKLLGFKQLTYTNGDDFAHQVKFE